MLRPPTTLDEEPTFNWLRNGHVRASPNDLEEDTK